MPRSSSRGLSGLHRLLAATLALGVACGLPFTAGAQLPNFINPYAQLQQQALQAQQQQQNAQAQANVRASALGDVLSRDTAQRQTSREGTAAAAEGGASLQTPAGRAPELRDALPTPFGASLFEVAGVPPTDQVNPDYVLQPGDRIGLNVLGGASAPVDQSGTGGGVNPAAASQIVTTVDPQGNIFLPEVGAVHVGGVRASALQSTIQQAAGRSYTSNVRFYAVLLSTHRVGVYVAGFVARPGRYAGSASDSVLDYLIRAGGVDPTRGSYRRIAVRRGATEIARVDLYDFLLTGQLPTPNLREGDTIFVDRQGPTVVVDGSVRNNYLFELARPASTGEAVIELARPLPSATNAVITGTRDGKPVSEYVALPALPRTPVLDQDHVTFVSDRPAQTVRVRVEGSRLEPSVLILPTDTRLPAALAQVRTDPALADLPDVFVLRRSVALQQQRVVEEAANRLERALFLARSPTSGVAAIRASEANLISSYIQRARRTAPDGLIVVAEGGRVADLRLEDDDVIVIPKKSQTVLVSGEVLQPQAVLYRADLKREDYVRLAGGYSERGRRGHFIIRRANGSFLLDKDVAILPGDELIALPYIDAKTFQVASDVLALIYQVAFAASVTRNY